MSNSINFRINFTGGIISPGHLYNILVAATKACCGKVSFGLRQELFIPVDLSNSVILKDELKRLNILYQISSGNFPCIVSSYPAEEIFINNTWVSEGVYKDIFDQMDYQPRLKVNISDSNQSFTPMLTGNINLVASVNSPHFWHLFIRFPKTNIVCEWKQLVYTNDIAKLSKIVEELMLEQEEGSGGDEKFNGDRLFNGIKNQELITKPADAPASLPSFNLPYYEGLNRYNGKSWLGIYRRDEIFDVAFLKELCRICLDTRIGQICSTPWKSLIIKGIEEKDRYRWNQLLDMYQINMRHAANELNFQVEDQCLHARALKQWLVSRLNDEDIRSFGLCIGIKTRRKSEVFSSILVRRRPLVRIFKKGFLYVYDVLCARDFNPNERTGFIFSRNNPKFLLGEQLRRAILLFYRNRSEQRAIANKKIATKTEPDVKKVKIILMQCSRCLTVYDPEDGDPEQGIESGVLFADLPENYVCNLCEEPKEGFRKLNADVEEIVKR